MDNATEAVRLADWLADPTKGFDEDPRVVHVERLAQIRATLAVADQLAVVENTLAMIGGRR